MESIYTYIIICKITHPIKSCDKVELVKRFLHSGNKYGIMPYIQTCGNKERG